MQPKLAIGEVNDPLEHEADRIADNVMRMPDPKRAISPAPSQLSQKCTACHSEDERKVQIEPAEAPEAAGSEAPGLVRARPCA